MVAKAGAFFNVYKGISGTIEKQNVADSYYFDVNGFLPGLESIKLGAAKYSYNEHDHGSRYKLEYKPNSLLTLGFEAENPESIGSENNSIYIETTYKFNTPYEDQLEPIQSVSNNIWDRRYDTMERDNTIRLEAEAAKDPTLGMSEYNVGVDATAADDITIGAFSTLSLNTLKDEVTVYDTNK